MIAMKSASLFPKDHGKLPQIQHMTGLRNRTG